MVRVLKGTPSTPSFWRVSRETSRLRPAIRETRRRSTPTEKSPDYRLSIETDIQSIREIDLELLDDIHSSKDSDDGDEDFEEDDETTGPKKRGRKKGIPLDEANRLAIQVHTSVGVRKVRSSVGSYEREEQIQAHLFASLSRGTIVEENMEREKGNGMEGKAQTMFHLWGDGAQQTLLSKV